MSYLGTNTNTHAAILKRPTGLGNRQVNQSAARPFLTERFPNTSIKQFDFERENWKDDSNARQEAEEALPPP